MKVSKLIEFDAASKAALGLEKNFGDSYLCRNNLIFRNIREQSLSLGFQFSAAPNPLYLALPLSQLDTILSSKVIPYHDNVTVLQSLQAADWTEIQENLKTNHVLHESCHAVSRSVVNEFKIKKCVVECPIDRRI